MTTDNRTNEQDDDLAKLILAPFWNRNLILNSALAGEVADASREAVEALRVAGRLAGEPNDEQVEAAAREVYGDDPAWGYVNDYGGGEVASQWRHLGESIQEMFRLKARAALVAAQGAAPQAESIIDGRCRTCGGEVFEGDAAEVVEHLAAPVQPSSTVDEEAIAARICEKNYVSSDGKPYCQSCLEDVRAVVDAIGGESRG